MAIVVFFAVVAGWGAERATSGDGRVPPIARPVAAGALKVPGPPGASLGFTTTPGAVTATPGPADAIAATPATAPTSVASDQPLNPTPIPSPRSVPPTIVPVPVVPKLSAAEEQARYAALENVAKRATAAMLAGDSATVASLLAMRCPGIDVAAIIETRQFVAQQETGKPLTAIQAAQPLIAHFDTEFGEAHLLVQVDAPGRITLTAYEGWVWERGEWRLAPCVAG